MTAIHPNFDDHELSIFTQLYNLSIFLHFSQQRTKATKINKHTHKIPTKLQREASVLNKRNKWTWTEHSTYSAYLHGLGIQFRVVRWSFPRPIILRFHFFLLLGKINSTILTIRPQQVDTHARLRLKAEDPCQKEREFFLQTDRVTNTEKGR